jgi:hypothetical protein
MSAILYARNNSDIISTKQIIRKILEDALLQNTSEKAILLSKLVEYITRNYAITLSDEEVNAVIKDPKFSEIFDYYEDNGFKVSLKHKRRILLEQKITQNKNLGDYIAEFVKTQNLNDSKIDVFYRFFYGVFTTNLEGYKQLLKEKNILQVDDSSFADEDKIIINQFLDWDDKGKNAAIFNLASFALEYCMLTNKKDALFELNNLKNKNLYLDSNIIFRAIGVNGEDRQLRTEQFLSKFSKVGQNLYVTKETDTEIKETIDYYISKLNRALTPVVKVNPKVYVETVDIDGFYKFYYRWKVGRTDGSVGAFKIHLLAKYEELLSRFRIQKDSIKPFVEEDIKDLLSDYESQILSHNEEKSYSAASVDARNIIWIEHRRGGQNDDIYQVKCFFVSSDQHLRRWDFNRNTNEVPIVMLPSQWLSMVLRYMERSDDDYKSFVCFLNMKTNNLSLSEEQLLFAIEGISEITSDIAKQTYLIKAFVKEDFNNKLHGLTNEELQEKAKEFAESEYDKRIRELENDSRHNKLKISKLEDDSLKKEQRINKLEKAKAKHGKLSRVKISELQEQLKDVGTKLKQKESDYNQLKDEHEKMRLRRWKTPRCLCVFVVLLIWVVFLLLCFVATDWEYNYCSKILNWIANLDDNRKDIAKQIIFWPYLTLGICIIYCFISLLLVKSEDEKNDWHKKFLQAIKNKMGLS